jgi:hypothetical protein
VKKTTGYFRVHWFLQTLAEKKGINGDAKMASCTAVQVLREESIVP